MNRGCVDCFLGAKGKEVFDGARGMWGSGSSTKDARRMAGIIGEAGPTAPTADTRGLDFGERRVDVHVRRQFAMIDQVGCHNRMPCSQVAVPFRACDSGGTSCVSVSSIRPDDQKPKISPKHA